MARRGRCVTLSTRIRNTTYRPLAWTPDGALCVNHHRGAAEPSCCAEKYNATCDSFAGRALRIDEYDGP